MVRKTVDVMRPVISLTVALCLSVCLANCLAADFQGIDNVLAGTVTGVMGEAFGVSANGSVVVGTDYGLQNDMGFYWTSWNGTSAIGSTVAGGSSTAYGVSGDGNVVVGYAPDPSDPSNNQAFRWTPWDGMQALGGITGSTDTWSSASAVSADGSTIVGEGHTAFGVQAFRWTAAGGMVGLGGLSLENGGYYSVANAVSADGSVIVGGSTVAGHLRAFRWTTAGGMVALGSDYSSASGVSADGSVVVGFTTGSQGYVPFRWTAAGGMVALGTVPGGNPGGGFAYGVSTDGRIVLGNSTDAATGDQVAFVWDKTRGMQRLQDMLVGEFGLSSLAGWSLSVATAISSDGQTIVGYGVDPTNHTRAWRANIDGVTRSWTGLAGDGCWEEPSNWSKWGRPGPQTSVLINPSTSLTLNGPTTATSINSLSLGAIQSGVAQLVLGGSLSMNELTIQARGNLTQNAGYLQAWTTGNDGTVSQAYGATLDVGSSFRNNGAATFGGTVIIHAYANPGPPYDQFDNRGTATIQSGAAVQMSDYSGGVNSMNVGNSGTLNLEGGAIQGGTLDSVHNDASGIMNARGTIAANLINSGTLNLTGTLEISTGNTATNSGQVKIGTGCSLHTPSLSNSGVITINNGSIVAASTTNYGVVSLSGGGITTNGTGSPGEGLVNGSGGVLSGYGALTASNAPIANQGGLIYATGGLLTIDNLDGGNTDGGELRVAAGSTMNVNRAFTSSGLIALEASTSRLGGKAISNTGTIVGCGQVSNTVHNSGVILADGGRLTISGGSLTNTADGQMQVSAGATLFLTQGLAHNDGTIDVAGGTFDTNNTAMTNAGFLAGCGVIRTRTLTNAPSGLITVADTATVFYGAVANSGNLSIIHNATNFYGNVTNSGTISTTSATVRFLAGFTNNGIYHSDPSTQYFQDLNVGQQGALISETGDKFVVSGNLPNASLCNTVWNTEQAELDLSGGVSHRVGVAGLSHGWGGFHDNFAWGVLSLSAGALLVLEDGNATPGGALYVHELLLADGRSQISRITGNGMNLYYDSRDAANDYLLGQSYALAAGGMLMPVPTLPGDANRDDAVNGADLNVVLSNYNRTFTGDTWVLGDFNGDGSVNGADLNVVLSNYNQTIGVATAVPEPSAFILVIAGIIGLLGYATRCRHRT